MEKDMETNRDKNFSQFDLFESVLTFVNGEKKNILVERRRFRKTRESYYTKIEEAEYRGAWSLELAKAIKNISCLSIFHDAYFSRSKKIIK
jgi:hypothetical protein